MSYFVHESSYVDSEVEIGEGTKIWHFCTISKNVKIGKNCSIGAFCHLGPGVVLGDNCKLQNGISLFEGVILEDYVFLGPYCVTTNVINPRSFINKKHEFRKTLFKKGSSAGANSTIICGNIIGEYVMIGAGSVVTKNIPSYSLVYGNPAKIHGKVDKEGNIIK